MPLFHSEEHMEMRAVANPLGAKFAWAWLARTLNQRPRPITATLLLAFLKPTAHLLGAAYPKQFPKLLRFVKESYLVQVGEMVKRLGDDAAEERAGMRLLSDYVDTTLKELRRHQVRRLGEGLGG